jgi:hypothetical protein
MAPWAHAGTLAALGARAGALAGKPSFAGNTQGWVAGSAAAAAVLRPAVACATRAACIAPPGASLKNHRYDQAVLSALAHALDPPPVAHTELLAASAAQLRPCGRSSAPRAVWTSRAFCRCYAPAAAPCGANATAAVVALPVEVGGKGAAALHMS